MRRTATFAFAAALFFATVVSGSASGEDAASFDADRFDAEMRLCESRRADLRSQVEALNGYWDAVNKAVVAQNGLIRNRQLADAVREIRRARIDAEQELQDACDRIEALRSLRSEPKNLLKGRSVTRAGVRSGWRAALALHEASLDRVQSPVGFRQISSSERSADNWISTTTGKSPAEDCPEDCFAAIDVFGWASRKNLVPRPSSKVASLLIELVRQSHETLLAEIELANADLDEAEAKIVALRQTAWNAINPPVAEEEAEEE